MFSVSATMPITLIGSCCLAIAVIAPTTAAAPPISYFISVSIESLILMPPLSKQTPLPTNATGLSSFLPPCHCMQASRDGCALPWPTESRAYMRSFLNRVSSMMSTTNPSASSACMRLQNSLGVSMLAGSCMRSFAIFSPASMLSMVCRLASKALGC